MLDEDLSLDGKRDRREFINSAFTNCQIGWVAGKMRRKGRSCSIPGMNSPRVYVLLDDSFALEAGMVRMEINETTHGTGSYPEPPQGLHLRIRQIARAKPFMGPCFRRASMAYWLHVGVNRHEGGVRGEMNFW